MVRVGGAELRIPFHLRREWDICGSVWVSEVDLARRDVFGWPDGGGLWVLPLPFNMRAERWKPDSTGKLVDIEDLRAMASENPRMMATYLHGGAYLGGLVGLETMGEFCEKLEELGARFYEDPGESKEVAEWAKLPVYDQCGIV
ncbi:hypothetical protein BU16DRAFT_555411 [Lophium mytilinum]|uniref:Uncharacterized protein n=1 Tax=Lophium mytilinum TaxID=390894 RepID=A0A6A6R836_9PEZI|nr:hypothetical protein BU16DRAFT_555411 [Lophium mytilinum]